jgi:hypothetical protein
LKYRKKNSRIFSASTRFIKRRSELRLKFRPSCKEPPLIC